jgi:hypothetical protein
MLNLPRGSNFCMRPERRKERAIIAPRVRH